MIVCFEGPSAIGKTTLCNTMGNGFHTIPEVNLLFKRSGKESSNWYFEKQVERYQMCLEKTETAILDGDTFQPFWYNWTYNFPANFQSLSETYQFYLKAINTNQLRFPDIYFVFQADIECLKERKEKDKYRQRRNFEKHLKLIDSQVRYFNFLKTETDIPVEFVVFENLQATKETVLKKLADASPRSSQKDADNLQLIHQFLLSNSI